MEAAREKVRLAAVSDVHCSRNSAGKLQPLFEQMAQSADVLLICGDLTDYGLPEEAQILVKELGPALNKPVLAVLGNHDFEAGKAGEVRQTMADAGVHLLDGTTFDVHGVSFVGVKGFVGGFDKFLLEPWGEQSFKALIKETVDESLKLESALARMPKGPRVVLLHYSPIRTTVEGEPAEIFPLLGCSRLEEPLNRYPVNVVFHGHAHHGRHQGRTRSGVPVYNVSLSLLRHAYPDRPPFHLEEIALDAVPAGAEPSRTA